METTAYTSLSAPRPFDPHLHGDMTATTVGYGYNYHGKSPFPDRYDIVNRRGGGPRGGFAFTTGPTEGNYPQTILPSPTFNLGELGFSDGGWNPEGLQYTNRPRKMRLTGLRNSWPHRAYFVRSRQVFFRNVYGPMSTDEATPRAPTVIINGSKPIHGILKLSSSDQLNAPRRLSVAISSVAGRRAGSAKVGDTIQVFAAPRQWANPPLIFTGFVSDVTETANDIQLTCLDTLGFLTNETITEENIAVNADAAAVLKAIVAGSTYSPPIGRISTASLVTVPSGLTLKGKTRMDALQEVLGFINVSPTPMNIFSDAQGYINLKKLPEVDSATTTPLVAGRLPRTDVPQDFYPTAVEANNGDLDFYNVVTVVNKELDINVTYPATIDSDYPTRPVHRLVHDDSVTKQQYIIEGLPERFDIYAGEVMHFATSAGIAGNHRIYGVSWEMTPEGSMMTLTVGKQSASLIATMRYASNLSL